MHMSCIGCSLPQHAGIERIRYKRVRLARLQESGKRENE